MVRFGSWFELDWAGHPKHFMTVRHGKLPTGTTSCKAVRLGRAIRETWDGDCYAF
ncbi:hypothetical protein TIFTF001_041333 [Ficus carica]|uniref:Uncharacterized protein n=1 Tax=Ficus carica TaxID=3494 RepID=A0AA87Z4X2_FICCA|nr:hypothetical protein TIFTF001_041332 [Ficus carica]GMN29585.1 hypothetical protein TIFTF001_041333 [Ficus carica]